VYSTYLGGVNGQDGAGIAVDSTGAAYIGGSTDSPDFPVTAGAYQTTCYGPYPYYCADGYVAKLNADGSGLIYATFLGGEDWDYLTSIALAANGDVYVTGRTDSTDFPTTPGAFQTTLGGNCTPYQCPDAFVTKLNASGSALIYSTYVGGSAYDAEYASHIAIDATGAAYITAQTRSSDFPITAGAFQPTCGGGCLYPDAFITKLKPDGSGLLYSSYLGGFEHEGGAGIAVDASGAAYVTGWTFSTDFPTTPGSFQQACGCGSIISDGFVTKALTEGGPTPTPVPPTATATAVSSHTPTPPATSTATHTPHPTDTPGVTPTATPPTVSRQLYLPLLLNAP
jgi:hypothetical protein